MNDRVNDHEVRLALLEQAVKTMKDELHAINTNISKLVWIAAGSLIAAITNWVMRGGLFS